MQSRLAVSLLFILIAATFTSETAATFGKLRLWTGKVCGRTAHVYNRLTSRDDALMSAIKGKDKDKLTMTHFDGDSLPVRQNCVSFITVAARQIHRVLGLMSIK